MSDELDSILAGYDKPAEFVTAPGLPGNDPSPPTQNIDSILSGGQQTTPQGGFSITHNPAGSDPVVEYYKSGAKKGLPKPPRKTPLANQRVKPTSIPASTILTGALFLTMIDLILPMGFAALHNWQFPKAKIKAEDLKMTASQKNDLAPIADAVSRELNINASPVTLLLVGLVGIYATNAMITHNEAVSKQKIADEKTKKDALKAVVKNGAANIPFASDYKGA